MTATQHENPHAAIRNRPGRCAAVSTALALVFLAFSEPVAAMGSKPAAGDPDGPGVDNPVVNPGRQAGERPACSDKTSRWAVGQRPEDGVLQRIRRESGAAELRVLPEGAMVTREYRDDRVNVHLDASGRISAIICG